VSSALAVEVLLTGSASVDLAAFTITTALIAMGWTGYSRDQGAFPHDRALIRTQNAFVFVGAGLAIIFAAMWIRKKKEGKSSNTPERIIAIINIVISTVQFGLVAHLLNRHFDYNNTGVVDVDANILFNWAYPATIYAASVSVAVAFALLAVGKEGVSAGFGVFQLVTGVIALAWASNLQDQGRNGHGSFSDTSDAWQSFAIIAGAWSIVAGLIILVRSVRPENILNRLENVAKNVNRGLALLLVIVFCVVIGQVSSLYHKHYISAAPAPGRGNDMLIVDADGNHNYGNAVSPFAWPISIWTSAVVVSFGLEIIAKGGAAHTGIVALALTEAANLLGWAAQHDHFGSPVADSIEGTTRGWAAVCLGGSVVAFFLALTLLRSEHELTGDDFRNPEDRPKADSVEQRT